MFKKVWDKVSNSRLLAFATLGILVTLAALIVSVVSWNSKQAEAKQEVKPGVVIVPTWTPTAMPLAEAPDQKIVEVAEALPQEAIPAVALPTPTATPVAIAMAVASELKASAESNVQSNVQKVQPEVAAQQIPNNAALNAQQAQMILSEVDAEVSIIDRTPGYRDVRFGVTQLGQSATGSVTFDIDQTAAWVGRLVCDDVCNGFYLYRPSNGSVVPLTAQVDYPADFNYSTLNAEQRRIAAEYGINVDRGELLAQHLFITDVTVVPGDVLIVVGSDDPKEGVNRGFFFSWRFSTNGEAVQVGPLNQGR